MCKGSRASRAMADGGQGDMAAGDRLDQFDRKILAFLQDRGDIGPSELSALIHLSASQCSRRLQRLKDDGYVDRIAGLLNPGRLNLGVSAYVVVKVRDHSNAAERRFQERVNSLSEIVSCDYLTGDADYMLKVVTKDLESYGEFLSNKLLPGGDIESVRSNIIIKGMKRTTALPLEFC